MDFTPTAEDMHAIAADLNEIYDAQREEAWAEQEADHDWATRPHPLFEGEDEEQNDDCEPCGSHDLSDDAEALASAGFGSDEDYGCYGGEDW